MLDTPKRVADTGELTTIEIDESRKQSPEEITPWLDKKLRGELPVEGLDGSHGIWLSPTNVFQTNDVYYAPEYGAVMNSRSEIYEATAAEAKFLTPDYSLIPSKSDFNGTSLDEACIFMAWGGNTNYGHFLIDCLSGIMALEQAGIKYPLVSPTLKPFHRELLALLGVEVAEISEPIVHAKKAAWSSCMDHYLQAPNATILSVRDRILANIEMKPGGPDKVYVSRSRIDDKRRMVNEVELEDRLSAEGFAIIHPQDLSIADQVRLFRNASIVIGATGAQMANALFMRPGTIAMEITPSNYSGIWVRNICHLTGVNWFSHYFPSPITDLPNSSWLFSYWIDVDEFVKFALEASR